MKNFLSKTRASYPRNSKEGNVKKAIVWIVVVFVVLYSGKGVVSHITATITTPFYFVRHYLSTSSATVPAFIRGRTELLNEINTLKQELSAQQGTEATLASLMAENAELRTLLQASSSPRIAASVISRPPFSPYDTVIIDRGSDDSIIEFAPVYQGSNQAIGYVRSVFPQSALVTLFSSPGVEATVYVFGPNIFTTAYGEGGGVVRLSVPQGVSITKGNTVILPSLDIGVLGKIDEVLSVPTEPEQHAYVTMDVPLQSLRLVSVGTEPIKRASFSAALEKVTEAEQALFTVAVPENFTATTSAVGTSTATTTVMEE